MSGALKEHGDWRDTVVTLRKHQETDRYPVSLYNRVFGENQNGVGGPLLGYLRRFTELALPQVLRESKCSLADEVGKGISSDRTVRAKHRDVARIMSGWGGGWSTL